MAFEVTALTQHFEISRRNTSPTATGRIDTPSFFSNGTKAALDMKVAKAGEARPERNKFTNAVRFSRKAGTAV
jgi:hypothetical protein